VASDKLNTSIQRSGAELIHDGLPSAMKVQDSFEAPSKLQMRATGVVVFQIPTV
jgi:hypothetical protein